MRTLAAIGLTALLYGAISLGANAVHAADLSAGDQQVLKDLREEALADIADEAHESSATLYRMEHAIHPWVAFLVLPVFAFANSGIAIH